MASLLTAHSHAKDHASCSVLDYLYMANIYFQCYVLCHIYLFSISVDRDGAAAGALLTKDIPLRLLVEKKVDVMTNFKGCQNENFNNHVTQHGAC